MLKQVILVTAAAVAIGVAGLNQTQNQTINRHFGAADLHHLSDEDAVKRICDSAHNETNGYTEAQCGFAQDVTGTEYICPNIKPGANCWVEAL